MTICPRCTIENRKGARFCRNCGEVLEQDSNPCTSDNNPKNPANEVFRPGEHLDDHPESVYQDVPSTELDDNENRSDPHSGAKDPGDFGEPNPIHEPEKDVSEQSGFPESTITLQEIDGKLDGEQTTASTDIEERLLDATPVDLVELKAGSILNKRYHILGVLARSEEQVQYEAEDLLTCSKCGALQSTFTERFCESCGTEIQHHPAVMVNAHPLPPDSTEDLPPDSFIETGWLYSIEQAQEVQSSPVSESRGMHLVVGFQSDVGQVRDVDEDSLLAVQLNAICEAAMAEMFGFFAIADGIGGHSAGEVASRTAIHSLLHGILEKVLLPTACGETLPPGSMNACLVDAIQQASQAILTHREKTGLDMGCTVTAALVFGCQAIIANVGDSRTYHMRAGKLTQVTNDHSVVANLIAAGLIKPEEVHSHEQKGVIYRSLGDHADVDVDTFNIFLEPGDRLLLCCDGVWEMVPDMLMEDVLLELHEPQAACNRLVELANAAGGEDNISVLIVDVQPLSPMPSS